ncbi:MAG: hypothetical protein LKE41_10020 [Prevotella sp.]|jgi:hypothetical protein|nr:hypothetical protein [Prevotella sp.]MCI2080151.1 hypothetical protein [Prevotella sp.]MCI2102048.1 hypothetical protein [Prevotella sp.]
MEKQFDFNQVGKRMPYGVPDGSFDRLQDNVMHEIKSTLPAAIIKPKGKIRKAWLVRLAPLTAVAAAALVAILLIPHGAHKKASPQEGSYAQVEQAFNNLSDADRSYLVSAYQDDLFLNQ